MTNAEPKKVGIVYAWEDIKLIDRMMTGMAGMVMRQKTVTILNPPPDAEERKRIEKADR